MLDNFIVPGYVDQIFLELGNDSKCYCKTNLELKLWESYPHHVEYKFNDRGYRDERWPINLTDAIWCFGDSFTLGLGSAYSHTWPYILRSIIKKPVINISMNGSSNTWIARKIKELLEELRPSAIIAHWSYTHRQELFFSDIEAEDYNNKLWKNYYLKIKEKTWPECRSLANFLDLPEEIQQEILTLHKSPRHKIWFNDPNKVNTKAISDEDRITHFIKSTSENDISETVSCVLKAVQLCESLNVPFIYGFVPNFAPDNEISKVMTALNGKTWGVTPRLDLARDRHHFDIKTSNFVVDNIIKLYL